MIRSHHLVGGYSIRATGGEAVVSTLQARNMLSWRMFPLQCFMYLRDRPRKRRKRVGHLVPRTDPGVRGLSRSPRSLFTEPPGGGSSLRGWLAGWLVGDRDWTGLDWTGLGLDWTGTGPGVDLSGCWGRRACHGSWLVAHGAWHMWGGRRGCDRQPFFAQGSLPGDLVRGRGLGIV